MASKQEQYNELAYYTLAHADLAFIHQNLVDAFAAQTATAADKPIKLTFALVGLYLCIEKGKPGARRNWRTCALPSITNSGRGSRRPQSAGRSVLVM